jgi:hypothetical protein
MVTYDLTFILQTFKAADLPAEFGGTVTRAAIDHLCPEHADELSPR